MITCIFVFLAIVAGISAVGCGAASGIAMERGDQYDFCGSCCLWPLGRYAGAHMVDEMTPD
jgi:hypothetical protein